MSRPRKAWSTAFAIACIAFGTAAVAAVLTLVNATLWRPLPFPQPERLVRIWVAERDADPRIDLSLPETEELQRALRGVEVLAAAARSRLVARLPGGTERLRGEAVDPEYFALIGLRAAQGRLFEQDDHAASAAPAMLISHALWSSRFGADPAVVGRTLVAGDLAYRVVGVLPAGFDGTIEDDVVEFWIPRAHYQPAALRTERAARMVWTLARLAPGIGLEALQAELDALHADWRRAHPELYATRSLRVEPLGQNWREPLRQNASLLLAAVFVLLAIAVCNVAALLLARALDRKRELALRSALGASRARLARELALQTIGLALCGGVLGALAAPWLLRALLALSPLQLPGYLDLSIDLRGLLAVASVLLLAALAAALLPAWMGSRVAPRAALAGESRSSASRADRRLWSLLMGGELALSFALLVLGALLLRSYVGLSSVELGFRRTEVLRLAITLAPADHGSPEQLPAMYRRLVDEIGRQPGVRSVGLVSPTLPPWDGNRPQIRHAALPAEAQREGLRVGAHAIDPALLRTLDVALLAGRGIGAGDDTSAAPVALVSAALAQRLGGAERVLGTEVELVQERASRPGGRFRVVGVVADLAWDGVGEQDTGRYIRYGANDDPGGARHDLYLALAQQPSAVVSIAVRTALPPETMIEPMRRSLARIAPASAVHWISSMEDELAGEYAASRFYLTLIAVFGLAALLLAAVGMFALLSHALLKREHELGIRLALGADSARIARLVLGEGLRLVLAGLALGLVLAWAGTRLLGQALYQVSATDPFAYAGAALVLASLALLSSLWPLRRALRLAPVTALRSD
jgi:predicted permease